MSDRLDYPLSHEWHVAINRHQSGKAGDDWDSGRFMYEAMHAADEVPRMAELFRMERESKLPSLHHQCSRQAPVPVVGNHLTCCLGVKTLECPYLLALQKIERCTPEDIDRAKAWTCAAHIISEGGDLANEGYLLTVSDRMYWDNLHESLAQDDEQ